MTDHKKSEHLSFRVSSEEKEKIKKAATQVNGDNASDFVRRSAVIAAKRTLAEDGSDNDKKDLVRQPSYVTKFAKLAYNSKKIDILDKMEE